ncbi:hypothetical protein [Celeribacter sp. ULVN23_4]
MTRHITDTSRRETGNGRTSHYVPIDRAATRAPTWDKIDRARKAPKDASRVKQFLRIDRGKTT